MHFGNEALLQEIRRLWHGALLLNRPGRARGQIGGSVAVRRTRRAPPVEQTGQFRAGAAGKGDAREEGRAPRRCRHCAPAGGALRRGCPAGSRAGPTACPGTGPGPAAASPARCRPAPPCPCRPRRSRRRAPRRVPREAAPAPCRACRYAPSVTVQGCHHPGGSRVLETRFPPCRAGSDDSRAEKSNGRYVNRTSD
ncbi:MAG: hypothetical protein V7631_4205 [Massilia sp.]